MSKTKGSSVSISIEGNKIDLSSDVVSSPKWADVIMEIKFNGEVGRNISTGSVITHKDIDYRVIKAKPIPNGIRLYLAYFNGGNL